MELHTMKLCASHGTACKLIELNASSCNATACKLQAHVTACNLIKLNASSWNCMQALRTACKIMRLHDISWNCRELEP